MVVNESNAHGSLAAYGHDGGNEGVREDGDGK